MKWRLIKLLCIAGAGILGALLFGDAVAGVVVAPFGWIIGKAVELGAEAKEVGVGGEVMEAQEGWETQELLKKNRFEEDWLERLVDEHHHSPVYSYYLSNIYYDPEVDDFGPPW